MWKRFQEKVYEWLSKKSDGVRGLFVLLNCGLILCMVLLAKLTYSIPIINILVLVVCLICSVIGFKMTLIVCDIMQVLSKKYIEDLRYQHVHDIFKDNLEVEVMLNIDSNEIESIRETNAIRLFARLENGKICIDMLLIIFPDSESNLKRRIPNILCYEDYSKFMSEFIVVK